MQSNTSWQQQPVTVRRRHLMMEETHSRTSGGRFPLMWLSGKTLSTLADRAIVSKRIQKDIKILRKLEATAKTKTVLDDFTALGRIPRVKTAVRKSLMTSVLDDNKKITNRTYMANVFAAFYEDLYSTKVLVPTLAELEAPTLLAELPRISTSEVKEAIRQLKRNKCADTKGHRCRDVFGKRRHIA